MAENNFIDRSKAKPAMADSLEELYSCLTCQICNQLMKEPTTLTCSHSFCMKCISEQKAWTCVFPGCNMPVTVGGKRSYVGNPQLCSIVESLKNLQSAINSAPKSLWGNNNEYTEAMSQVISSPNATFALDENGLDGYDSDDSNGSRLVSFAKYEKAKDDDESDATTLGDHEPITPILKKRSQPGKSLHLSIGNEHGPHKKKKLSTLDEEGEDSDTTTLDGDEIDNQNNMFSPMMPNGTQQSNEEDTSFSENQKPRSMTSPAIQNDDNEESSIATQPIEFQENKQNEKEILTDQKEVDVGESQEEVFYSENHTPTTILNKSCALPDMSFRLSPIAKDSNSQSQSQNMLNTPFKIGEKLKSAAEETDDSFYAGTTNEISPQRSLTSLPAPKQSSSSPNEGDKSIGANNREAKLTRKPTLERVEEESSEDGEEIVPDDTFDDEENAGKTSPEVSAESLNTKVEIENGQSKEDDKKKPLNASTIDYGQTKDQMEGKEVVERNVDIEGQKLISRAPIPLVFFISYAKSLTASDQRTFKKVLKDQRLALLQVDVGESSDLEFSLNFDSDDHCESFLEQLYTPDENNMMPFQYSYSICTYSEYQMYEGFMVSRSFRYILSVACGLSIVDMSFLRKASSSSFGASKYLYAPNTMKEQEETSSGRRKRSRGKESSEAPEVFHIIGDSDSIELMAPQRSRSEALQRCQNLGSGNHHYNNGLLEEFEIRLFGKFDDIPDYIRAQEGGKKRKPSRASEKNSNLSEKPDNAYTLGRVKFLLEICGATVQHCKDGVVQDFNGDKKKVVLTRKKLNAKQINKVKEQLGKNEDVSFVPLKWLEDSIAEFNVKDLDNY